MANLISLRAYARHRGVSLTAVQKAIKTGRIKTVCDSAGREQIDQSAADKQWSQSTDTSKQRGKEAQSGGDLAATFAKARAMRETYLAQAAKLEFERKSGRLIDSEKVKSEAFETGRLVRDAILNVPNRIAGELAAERDPKRVHGRMIEELTKALEELANVGKRRAGI